MYPALRVLPLTFEAAREGLWREAQRRKAVKASGKERSRDSAIWMTVLEKRTGPRQDGPLRDREQQRLR